MIILLGWFLSFNQEFKITNFLNKPFMKKFRLHFVAFLVISLFISCNQKEAVSEESDTKDRNMFGLYIPRGLTKTTEGLSPGYVMFVPTNSSSTYLVNRQGEVVHQWKSNYQMHTPYLNEDGSLSALIVDPDFPVFAGGGQAGRLQKISWDSKILWDFEYANEEHLAHHDIAIMPNGNFLAIAWEAKTAEEVLQAGRSDDMIPTAGLWPSHIVEVAAQGKNGGEIVWEWHIWDHLIQDNDPTKDNYGIVSEHPELLDINKGRRLPPPITQDSLDILMARGEVRRNQTVYNRGSDVFHLNAINYNEELDQIVFSSPALSEIFIIDHSTTTEEAAAHEGGKRGKGGDFLYRWGNPENYQQGDSTHRKLFGQHDIRWVETSKPGAGNLTVYNNDIPMGPDSLDYSAVYEIEPPINESGNYELLSNNQYGPEKQTWNYVAEDTLSFYGSFISGAHRLKNGNTFINEGPRGRFFEVTSEGEIVWEYLNPYRGNIHKPNGDVIPPIPFAYSQFRSTFIPEDHPALKNKKLVPLDPQPEEFKLPPKPKKEKT